VNNNNIIFVLGNGRSGTHFLAELISTCRTYQYNGEEEPLFSLSCKINIESKTELLPELIELYKGKNNYIDKCHPNLWIADKLHDIFPKALFVCAYRDKEGTINSMLKHKGCMSWFHRITDFPNRYLGIESADVISNSTDAELCEYRWQAHQNQIEYLKAKKLTNFFFFDYDNRVKEAKRLDYFLRINTDKSIIK